MSPCEVILGKLGAQIARCSSRLAQLMDVEITLPPELGAHPARLHTESLDAAPVGPLRAVDDRLTADEALRWARRGELLLYVGDHRNARQLLAAMSRRLGRRRTTARGPLEAFRAERRQRTIEHALLGRLLVAIDTEGNLALRRRAGRRTGHWRQPWARERAGSCAPSGGAARDDQRLRGGEGEGSRSRGCPPRSPQATASASLRRAWSRPSSSHASPTSAWANDPRPRDGNRRPCLPAAGPRRARGARHRRGRARRGRLRPRERRAPRFRREVLGGRSRRLSGINNPRGHRPSRNPPWLPLEPETRLDSAVFDTRPAGFPPPLLRQLAG